MALYPPVCTKCMVFYGFKHSYGWECPVCKTNSDHQKTELVFMEGDQDTVLEQLKANKRFYDFIMKGDDNVSSSDA